MDRFLAPHTSEAIAHSHLTYVILPVPPAPPHLFHSENWFTWDQHHPSFNETLVAGCASYQAFNRYLSGSDLFIVPRSRSELESVLSVALPLATRLPLTVDPTGDGMPMTASTMPSPSLVDPLSAAVIAGSVVPPAVLPSLSYPLPQTCMLAEKSIRDVLNTSDNAEVLLALHTATRQRQPPTPGRTLAKTGIRT